MKILPKQQDILKAKNDERKREIDSGIALASRIDKLRDTQLNEERQLKIWRENSLKIVQKEIDDYLVVKENLRIQTEEAELYRKKLLEPLDIEWEEINLEKVKINKGLNDNLILQEQLKDDEINLEQKRAELSELIIKAKDNEKDTEKTKSETVALQEMAQREYEIARYERESQSNSYDKAMIEVSKRLKEYEVALSLIVIRENECKEKEVDIIKREKHLESQQRVFRIAREELNK